jgi:hypothetical protein
MPSLTNFLTDKTSTFKYKCIKIVKQHYLELWTKQVKEGKLRTYLKIKTNFGYEHFEQRRRFQIKNISSQITNRNRKAPGYFPGKPNLLQVHFGSGRR